MEPARVSSILETLVTSDFTSPTDLAMCDAIQTHLAAWTKEERADLTNPAFCTLLCLRASLNAVLAHRDAVLAHRDAVLATRRLSRVHHLLLHRLRHAPPKRAPFWHKLLCLSTGH